MAKLKPHELTHLVVEEVSAVDAGANGGAKVLMLKSRCDNMTEKTERTNLLAGLAKYLGVGKQEGKKLIIDTDAEDDDMALDAETKKLLETQGAALAKFEAKDEMRSAVSKALADIAKAETPEAIDTLVTAAKAAATTVRTEKKIGDGSLDAFIASDVVAALDGAATTRKAAIGKAKTSAELETFRKKLPAQMQPAFDGMDATAQTAFMKSYTAPGGTDDSPLAKELSKALGTIAEQGTMLKALQETEATNKARDEFKDLADVVPDMSKFIKNVLSLRATNKAAADELVEGYRAMAKQLEKGNSLFQSFGKSRGQATNADALIDAAVAKRRAANPNETPEQAMAKVLEENPGLYTQHLAESNDARH